MNKSKNKTDIRRPALEYIYRGLSLFSSRQLFYFAKFVTYIVCHTNNQLSRQVKQNIRLCFPTLTHEHETALIKKALLHTCCSFLELAALWHHPRDKVLKLIQTQDICSSFRSSQKAKIIIVPHYGSWELLNLWLSSNTHLFSLYKPSNNSRLNNYILNRRELNGAVLVPTNTAGLRKLLSGLKKGASCMILPDQVPSANTSKIDADFYGHPASTSLIIKNLSERLDCKVYIAGTTRDLNRGNFKITINSLDRDKFITDDPSSAEYLNKEIEKFISSDISQYQWAYRRFSSAIYSKTG